MKIYTKTGDDGTTGLQGNVRVLKSNDRIMAYGAIDEINAVLGVALSGQIDKDVSITLKRIQNELFSLGADLSDPNLDNTKNRISDTLVHKLESEIDEYEKELEPLTNFILPGGTRTASEIHVARTITRRAEIMVVKLRQNQKINPNCGLYLNRLSDLLFVLARIANKRTNTADIIWRS